MPDARDEFQRHFALALPVFSANLRDWYHAQNGATTRLSTTTYIAARALEVWEALTRPEHTSTYWAHDNVSTWTEGAAWEHRRPGPDAVVDIAGTVLEARRPHRLRVTWANPTDGTAVRLADDDPRASRSGPSIATFDLSELEGITRLDVTHHGLADERERDALADAWAAILANLKSYLETGQPLPTPPWAVLAGIARARGG